MTATPANVTSANPNLNAIARSALSYANTSTNKAFSSLIDDPSTTSSDTERKTVRGGTANKSATAKKVQTNQADTTIPEINLSWLQPQTLSTAHAFPPMLSGSNETVKAVEKTIDSQNAPIRNDEMPAKLGTTETATTETARYSATSTATNQGAGAPAAQAARVNATQTPEKAAAQADTDTQSTAAGDEASSNTATDASSIDPTAAGEATESIIANFLASAGNPPSGAQAISSDPDSIVSTPLTGTASSAASATAPMLGGLAVTAGNEVGDVENSAPNQQAGVRAPIQTPPALQVSLSISRNINSVGSQSFTLQLKPEALGKVEVKLEIDAKGQATATFKADRPETLHLLQHDAQHLLTALNDAGISADSTDLNFSLNEKTGDQSNGGFDDSAANDRNRNSSYAPSPTDDLAVPTRTIASNRLYDIQA